MPDFLSARCSGWPNRPHSGCEQCKLGMRNKNGSACTPTCLEGTLCSESDWAKVKAGFWLDASGAEFTTVRCPTKLCDGSFRVDNTTGFVSNCAANRVFSPDNVYSPLCFSRR